MKITILEWKLTLMLTPPLYLTLSLTLTLTLIPALTLTPAPTLDSYILSRNIMTNRWYGVLSKWHYVSRFNNSKRNGNLPRLDLFLDKFMQLCYNFKSWCFIGWFIWIININIKFQKSVVFPLNFNKGYHQTKNVRISVTFEILCCCWWFTYISL